MRNFDTTRITGYRNHYYSRNDDNQGWKLEESVSVPSGYVRAMKHGTETPNYYQRMKRKELLPLTSYERVDESFEAYAEYQARSTNLGPSLDDKYRVGWVPDVPSFKHDPVDMRLIPHDALLQRAASEMQSNGHDTLTFIAELGKLRQMILRLPARVVQIAKKLKCKNYEDIVSSWLEYRYGWRTLWYDIQDINEVISKLESFESKFHTQYAQDIDSSSVTYTNEVSARLPNNYVVGKFWVETFETAKISNRGIVAGKLSPPSFQANVAVTAWELIPFSFVIDWFWSVGAAINAACFVLSKGQYFAAKGVLEERSLVSRCTSVGPYQNYDMDWCNYDIIRTYRRLSRVPTTVPLIPAIQVNLDAVKIVDLIALIYQFRK